MPKCFSTIFNNKLFSLYYVDNILHISETVIMYTTNPLKGIKVLTAICMNVWKQSRTALTERALIPYDYRSVNPVQLHTELLHGSLTPPPHISNEYDY